MTPDDFMRNPTVIAAVQKPRDVRSVLNYFCASDTADPDVRKRLCTDDAVAPLLKIWFESGSALDAF